MELKISEVQELAPITFNFEELKQELVEKSKKYATAVYTEDTIAEAKKDRASLNKLVKAVNDEKIRIKNEVMKPYEPFEKQIKELMEIVQDAVNNIDGQVKTFEQKKKDEKLQLITDYFIKNVAIYEGLIDFDLIFNERWLNVTYDIDAIFKEIDHIFAKTKNDLMTINNIVQNEETNKQVTDFYFKNINKADCLGLALNEAKAIEATKSKIAEMKKQEEEKKVVTGTAKQTIIPESEQQEKLVLYSLKFEVVEVTKEQAMLLKEFFINNNIKYRKL